MDTKYFDRNSPLFDANLDPADFDGVARWRMVRSDYVDRRCALSLAMIISPPNQQEVLPGVWRFQVGGHDEPTLTKAAGAVPKADRIASLPKAELPFDLGSIQEQKTRDASVIRIPLKPGEKIFGLGLQMNGIDRRGGVYHLRVDHYASGHDRLHVPTPLYVSSSGYAVFFNTSRPIDIYVGVGTGWTIRIFPTFGAATPIPNGTPSRTADGWKRASKAQVWKPTFSRGPLRWTR